MSTRDLSKKCSRCKTAPRETTSGQCRSCRNKTFREYYRDNPEVRAKVKAEAAARYERVRAVVWEAKSKPCADCGVEYPPYVMQFDHRPDEEKTLGVAQLLGRGNIKRIQAEIKKCDVVCANCHAERTHSRLVKV